MNLPSNDIKFVAAQITPTDKGPEHAAIINTTATFSPTSEETIYHADLKPTVTGVNPFTGKMIHNRDNQPADME